MKVNILEENAESGMVLPEGVEAWKGVLNYLNKVRLKQDLPEIIQALSDKEVENRWAAVSAIKSAAWKGIDIGAAIPALTGLLSDSDKEIRYYAGASVCANQLQNEETRGIPVLFENNDADVQEGAISALYAYAKCGDDISFAVPTLQSLLRHSNTNVKHDAAIAIGYQVMHNGTDVSTVIPDLAGLLTSEDPEIRAHTLWTFCQIAENTTDISVAVPVIQGLLADSDEEVKNMAQKVLGLI